jgi:hypothetical protein
VANSLETQLIVDGPTRSIFKIVGVLDTSNLATTTIILPDDLSEMSRDPLVYASTLRINRIIFDVEDGLAVRVWWAGGTDTNALICSLSGRGAFPNVEFGGFTNNSAGSNGGIAISTSGWASQANLAFTLTFDLIKSTQPPLLASLTAPSLEFNAAANSQYLPVVTF